MKKILVLLIASLALVVGQPMMGRHWSEAAAQIPLPAGQFSSTAQGSFGICIDPNTGAPESCSTSGVVLVAFNGLANGSFTLDSAGNACGVLNEVDTLPLAPVYLGPPPFPGYPPAPAFVSPTRHIVAKVLDYDAATGTGDRSQTAYEGGTCNGAHFNSSGAMALGESTVHFVVTNRGNRIDVIQTSNVFYVSPKNHANVVGDFSVSGTDLRQTSQNSQ